MARLLVVTLLVGWLAIHSEALAVALLVVLAVLDVRLASGTLVATLGLFCLRFLDLLSLGMYSLPSFALVILMLAAAIAFFLISFQIVRGPRPAPGVEPVVV